MRKRSELNHQIETEVLNFLGDLKVSSAASEIIAILKDENYIDQSDVGLIHVL